ncbi:hypothetical protein A2Z67_05275 [Candidatus Woesebacteria bacterium RBG_13_36_22]|uniref:T4 RNA ligase 1-like N-terminal domain-containing protein n=1 Tax=Candidatus Woesebacteria bacterium RBG_13_36_22 TaxID=1802478 RepID=A0A1F7X2J9_9BACT|nr:MAG: hypothetical protein A2Z67_05275 [Candidatus Woesebacteria bacterium RBG_13_36_22]
MENTKRPTMVDSLGQKYKASQILGIEESRLSHFKEQDPFNPEWTLEGYISNSERLYGSMLLLRINDFLTEQVIISTPKQKYPFDKLGRFKFPSTKHINVYEKLDGTNILAYSYTIKKKRWITYKTRLTPVLNKSRWGDWEKMWREMLDRYGMLYYEIEKWAECGINLSFELFGSRNKHLIEYTVPLDTALLFGIRNDIANPKIIDPEKLRVPIAIPVAKLHVSIRSGEDLYSWYQKLRKEREALNRFTEDGFIIGEEGAVWYLTDINDRLHQYKMKPESIEAIHWANSGMAKNAITTTVINAYEMSDEVTYEKVKELLLEEFDERNIEIRKDLILKVMGEVKNRIEFRERVFQLYGELKLDLQGDKAGTMRALSSYFDRKDMRKVFNLLNDCLF